MKIRKQTYGNKNLVGKNIERLRKEKGIGILGSIHKRMLDVVSSKSSNSRTFVYLFCIHVVKINNLLIYQLKCFLSFSSPLILYQ